MNLTKIRIALLAIIFVALPAFAISLAELYIPAHVTSVGSYASADSTAIKVNTLVKGFASNDPYFPKVVSVPKAGFFSFARANMGGLLKANAWWLAFSIAAGYMMTDDGPVIVGNYYDASKYFDRGNCNNGTLLNSNLAECEAKTQQVHGTAFKKWISPGWYQCSGTTYQSGFCGGAINPVKFYRQFQKDSSTGYSAIMLFPAGTQLDPPTVPVTDARLESDFLTICAANPLDCADAFQDPEGVPYPQLFPDTTYLPNVNPADEPFLNCYFSGQLQTSNPSGACYATQDTYNRIKAIADALIAAQTPEGQASAANATLKDPLTQKQLEETLKKEETKAKKEADEIDKIDKKAITDAYADSKITDEYNKLKERITDPSKLPELPPLPAQSQIDLPTYRQCQTITMNFFNGVLTFPNPDQCQKLEQVKTGLGYLMYVLTALGLIMELFRRVE